jgi:hypothetical protein
LFGDKLPQLQWLDDPGFAGPAEDPPQHFLEPVDLKSQSCLSVPVPPDLLGSMPNYLYNLRCRFSNEFDFDVETLLATISSPSIPKELFEIKLFRHVRRLLGHPQASKSSDPKTLRFAVPLAANQVPLLPHEAEPPGLKNNVLWLLSRSGSIGACKLLAFHEGPLGLLQHLPVRDVIRWLLVQDAGESFRILKNLASVSTEVIDDFSGYRFGSVVLFVEADGTRARNCGPKPNEFTRRKLQSGHPKISSGSITFHDRIEVPGNPGIFQDLQVAKDSPLGTAKFTG